MSHGGDKNSGDKTARKRAKSIFLADIVAAASFVGADAPGRHATRPLGV